MITPNVSCSCVCLYSWFSTTFAFASLRSSILIRIPSRFDSSVIAVIPSIRLSRTSSAIFSISRALLTMYGISVTMIRLLPFCIDSMFVTARTRILPFPVRYASSIPLRPNICAPVGKSGPLTISMISSRSVSRCSSMRLSMIFTTAAMTSRRLCGGIFVAIPTAIPFVPFTSKFGKRAGSTVGSFSVSSKFGTKSTVSFPMSASISIEILLRRASVYRIAAAPSPSTEPKLPCPSTSG